MGTTDPVSEAFKADLQARWSTLSANAQAQIATTTGVDIQNQQVQAGASAAVGLASNGFNPSSPQDNQELLNAINGGLVALGPATAGVTVLCAGALIAMQQIGEAAYCPLVKAFAQIGLGPADGGVACGGAACSHTGTATPETILGTNSGALPYMPVGSFSSLAINALALNSAHASNCLPALPSGLVVDACVSIWNKTHQGPAVAYYVPPLGDPLSALAGEMIVHWPNISGNASILQITANKDPNVYFGFWPVSYFSGLSGYYTASDGTLYFNYPTTTAASLPGAGQLSPPRYVMVNSGGLITSFGKPSTAQVVASHGLAIAAGGLAAGLAYAFVSGKAAEAVFGSAWSQLASMTKGALGVVEKGVRIPLSAGESIGSRRRRRHAR